MRKMRRCAVCGEYTMRAEHCGKKSVGAHPPPYNPNDRYARYRRAERGVL